MCINKKRLYNLFKNLVDIYSPSGKEKEVCDFLYSYLCEQGFKVIKQKVDTNRYNIIILNETKKNDVMFTGHIDTVTASDYENYKFYHKNNEIYGLGTSDMKSGCSAMIESFISLKENKKKLPAALCLVVGEEEYGDGTEKLLEEYHFPWAIVGEPTGLCPCLSHYGYIEIMLNTSGKRMHASLSHKKHNAINKMLSLLTELTNHLDMNRKKIIYNIRDMTSTQAGFVVPDRCESWIDLHLPPYYPTGEVTVELEQIIKNNFSDEYHIEYTMIHSGYKLPDNIFLNSTLKKIYKQLNLPYKTGTFYSDSDATILWQSGVKPIILGPGYLEKAHTHFESINFNQVIQSSKIYYKLLENL